jgi:ABC-type phosphate/phosphonate transport system ATPase subunit
MNVSTIHDHTNTDRHHQNGNIISNEWQRVKDNKKWKNNRRNDTGKPQQITTIVNQYAVLSNITNDCDRQKRLEATNKKWGIVI